MDDLIRINDKIFNDTTSPLNILSIVSDTVKYNNFATQQTNTNIWTPSTGKSIYLTSISIASTAAVNVTLGRAANATFLVVRLTTTFNTYVINFDSVIKFNTDESIVISTSALSTVDITLFGYER